MFCMDKGGMREEPESFYKKKNSFLVQLHFYKISKTFFLYQRNWKVQTNSAGKLEAFPV